MTTAKMVAPYDVIVIGAGCAGMTAAYRILKAQPNARILVLEAKDRIGGRTLVKEMNAAKGKDVWDFGGQWIGRNQHHVLWLMKEFDLTHYNQYSEGTKFMQMPDGKRRTYDEGLPMSIFTLLDISNITRIIDKLSKTVPVDDPRKAKNADEWDGMTMDAFFKKKMYTKEGRQYIADYLKGASGSETKTASVLYTLWAHATSGSNMDNDEGSPQEWKIKGGTMQLCERIQDVVGKDNVLIGEPVSKIDQSEKDIVRVTTATGKDFECKYVINAAPLDFSVDLSYIPKKPIKRIELARFSPVGHLIKIIITYQKAFWKDKGYSGSIFIMESKEFENSPLRIVMDASTPNGNPALVGFYANSEYWGDKSIEECREAVLASIAEFFGDEAREPIDFMQLNWQDVPFNGGCVGNTSVPGAISLFQDGLRTPFDRVHWAGTESATVNTGYIDGAIQSGIRASDEVLARLWPELPKDDLLKQLNPSKLHSNNKKGTNLWRLTCSD